MCRACAAAMLGVHVDTFDTYARRKTAPGFSRSIVGAQPAMDA